MKLVDRVQIVTGRARLDFSRVNGITLWWSVFSFYLDFS